MVVQVIQTPPIPVAMIRHYGSYDGIGPAFEQLWGWVEANSVPATRSIGIYYDNPDYVPVSRLRSAACAEIPQGCAIPDRGNLPITIEQIAGGMYATTTYVGPYERLAPVWSAFTNYIERNLHRRIKQNDPAFEVYVNDPSCTPASELITELYMPVY